MKVKLPIKFTGIQELHPSQVKVLCFSLIDHIRKIQFNLKVIFSSKIDFDSSVNRKTRIQIGKKNKKIHTTPK